MSNSIKDMQYSENINCQFAEALYQKAVSDRYGIQFCCEQDSKNIEIKKELLDLNNIMDKQYTMVV